MTNQTRKKIQAVFLFSALIVSSPFLFRASAEDKERTLKEIHTDHGHTSQKEKAHEEHEAHGEEDDHEGEENRKVGKGKAIVAIHEGKGFRLSAEAYRALGIQLEEAKGSRLSIPRSALVRVRDTTAIYRYHDGFFQMFPVKVLRETKDGYLVDTPLTAGDRVVIQGTELLRVADIYAQDTSDYGHGH